MTLFETNQDDSAEYPDIFEIDQFYRTYGAAIFAWQEVETALFKLYHSINVLNGERDIMISARAYYKKKSFGPKLKLVSDLVTKVCPKKYIDWNALESDLKCQSDCRNLLVHSPVQLSINPDGSVYMELVEPMFMPSSMRRSASIFRKYDSNEFLVICSIFKDISRQIDTEREKIPHKFRNNKLILPVDQ